MNGKKISKKISKKASKKLRGVFEKVPGSGVWWIQYFDAFGRRRREIAGRRRDAIDLLAKRKTEKLQRIKLPENLRAKAVTFGVLMNDALEHSRAENSDRATAELKLKYDTLRPVFGNRVAEEISKQDIVRWLTEQNAEREWAAATKNRWQAAFSLAFRVGMDNEKLDKNPASRILRRIENNGRVRFLSQEEETALRAVLQEKYPQHVPAFDLSIHTGMRAGEQFSLRWNQVDFKRHVLTLPKTKNGQVRHIPLNAIAVEALNQLKTQAKDGGTSGGSFVFLNSDGGKLRGPRDWFEPVVQEARLEDFTWHCLRHTFASRLVMAGVDLRTVAQLMGHKTIQMTMRYSHLAPDHQQSAVERLVGADGAVAASQSQVPP
jgi:integrase